MDDEHGINGISWTQNELESEHPLSLDYAHMKQTLNTKQTKHAIVIGGSIAGLLAARVLADYVERVTLIERDHLPNSPHPRRGTPQAGHVHVLLAKGLEIIEALFPGIGNELAASGATQVDWGRESRTFGFNGWLPAYDHGPRTFLCSRDLLEFHIRARTLANPNIHTLQTVHAIGLEAGNNDFVKGVVVRDRTDLHTTKIIEADLIVDASGRESKLPSWLQELGYAPPHETRINSFLGYSSRLYRPDPNYALGSKVLLVRKRDADHASGAGIYTIENNLWQVNLGASGKAYPPTDDAGFVAFLRALPVADLYEAIKHAQPITTINGYRRTENRWRHYETLTRMPHNVVALGDAACAFNPVYGQGMSVAALGAVALGEALQQSHIDPGFARRYQRTLAHIVRVPWLMATSEDFRTPITEGGKPNLLTRLSHRYFDRVMAAAMTDPIIHRTFFEVLNLLKPPAALYHPTILWKALRPNLRSIKQGHAPKFHTAAPFSELREESL